MKKVVAIASGGTSSEYVVSMKSASTLLSFIDKEKYAAYQIVIGADGWFVLVEDQKLPLNKDDFSFTLDGQEIKFDFVYNTIHGTPGEDGKLQGYLDLLDIPYSGCNVITSAVTFNKNLCKRVVNSYGITTAKSVFLSNRIAYNTQQIQGELSYPSFVKPNNGGSSFGASKVDSANQLEEAIKLAFEHDTEVLIEEFIRGTEVTCGVYQEGGLPKALPVTEISTKNDFFDYAAKYEGASEEITPARIGVELTDECQKLSEKIYALLNCRGLVRIDYLIKNDELYFVEVNTTPGFSMESIIPQQIRAAGLDVADIVNQQVYL